MFVIKITCWDYPNPEPYTDYVLAGQNEPMKFKTKDEAMVTLLS